MIILFFKKKEFIFLPVDLNHIYLLIYVVPGNTDRNRNENQTQSSTYVCKTESWAGIYIKCICALLGMFGWCLGCMVKVWGYARGSNGDAQLCTEEVRSLVSVLRCAQSLDYYGLSYPLGLSLNLPSIYWENLSLPRFLHLSGETFSSGSQLLFLLRQFTIYISLLCSDSVFHALCPRVYYVPMEMTHITDFGCKENKVDEKHLGNASEDTSIFIGIVNNAVLKNTGLCPVSHWFSSLFLSSLTLCCFLFCSKCRGINLVLCCIFQLIFLAISLVNYGGNAPSKYFPNW